MHYSRGAWDAYSPDEIIAKMNQAGVSGALASSTPDEGSLRLLDAAPDRMVGGFRPYRESTDLGSWYREPELLAYSEKRLGQGRHRVFGEVHIHRTSELDDPGMARYVALARERGLYFHVHSDAEVVEGLFARWPDLKVPRSPPAWAVNPCEYLRAILLKVRTSPKFNCSRISSARSRSSNRISRT